MVGPRRVDRAGTYAIGPHAIRGLLDRDQYERTVAIALAYEVITRRPDAGAVRTDLARAALAGITGDTGGLGWQKPAVQTSSIERKTIRVSLGEARTGAPRISLADLTRSGAVRKAVRISLSSRKL